MIPQGFIQDLLARVDVADVVGRHVQLKKAGQNLLGLCPFHGEKTPSFTVSPSKQFFHCFGCGKHGNAIGFLMEQRGLGYVDAIGELARDVGMQVPVSAERSAVQGRVQTLLQPLAAAADFYRNCLKDSADAIAYLKSRGLTGTIAARYALGYSPDAWQPLRAVVVDYEAAAVVEAGLVIADEGKRYDRFRGRVMFPIRNMRGQVIGFGARTLGGGEPKYLNSPETPVFHKGQELYGLFEAREAIRRNQRAILVEGYLDVIQLAQAGFDETVAALGTAVTSAHVTALFRLTDHVVFAFDGDAAGRKAARRALEAALPVMADTKRASFVLLGDGEDPDAVVSRGGAGAFEQALATALPLSRYLLHALTDGRVPGTAEERAALAGAAKPLLLSMAPGALRLQLLREVAEAAKMAIDELHSLYGLRRPAYRHPAPLARRTPQVEVADLKRRVLQLLLVHPALAHEFGEQIGAEHGHGDDTMDRQILEVWELAGAVDAAHGATITHGALLESLAERPAAAEYRALAAQEMEFDTDAEVARQVLAEAFDRLRLRRLETERSTLLAEYLKQPTAERLAAYQSADRAYGAARSPANAN